jgi:antitoxin MazE
MIVTVKKWGNSQGIRFPKKILELVNLTVNEDVEVEIKDNKIIISKIETNNIISLEKLFENYNGSNSVKGYDWDDPRGKEIW